MVGLGVELKKILKKWLNVWMQEWKGIPIWIM